MKLLAVSETVNGTHTGHIADIYLEVRPGSGNVYIDTFPLTKIDTQMSTRFAKEIACSTLGANCNIYDFFYRIRSESIIIGGPSAGAAISTLTFANLEGLEIDETVAITGTINSGGQVGRVGGIKAKIDAAALNGITKVLIPKGETVLTEDNRTIDFINYSRELGIALVEVSRLQDSVFEFTGKRYDLPQSEVFLDGEYNSIMRELAENLCRRSSKLREDLLVESGLRHKGINTSSVDSLKQKGEEVFGDGKHYSAASYCFGANVKYNSEMFRVQNLTSEQFLNNIDLIAEKFDRIDAVVEGRVFTTISDLETYMIVKERIIQGLDYLESAKNYFDANNREKAFYDLAYGIERYHSAESWARFFGKQSEQYALVNATVKRFCINKVSEAEERYQYVAYLFPGTLRDTKKEINRARIDFKNGNYELCIFKAAKAKAEADVVLNVFGLEPEHLPGIIEQKIEIVRESIARETQKGIFPILGYSYLEYAESLKDEDEYSAMLYLEYALELSSLDIYFEDQVKKGINLDLRMDMSLILFLVIGIGIGFVIASQMIRRSEGKKRAVKRHKRPKSRKKK